MDIAIAGDILKKPHISLILNYRGVQQKKNKRSVQYELMEA